MDAEAKKFTDTTAKMSKAGGDLSAAGMKMGIAGAAITAPLALAVRESTRFEMGLAKISTIMSSSVPQVAAQFGESIKKLSSDTGKSTADINESMYNAISSGIKAGDAMAFIETASKGAVGGFTSIDTSAKGLITVLNSYKMATSEAGRVQDQMFIANELGVTTFEQLAVAIGEAAAPAALYKIRISEVLAALSAKTLTGGTISQAATGFNAMLAGLSRGMEEAKDTVEALNKRLPAGKKIDFSTAGIAATGGLLPWVMKLKEATGGSMSIIEKLFRSVEAKTFIAGLFQQTEKFEEGVKRMDAATNDATYSMSAFEKVSGTAGNKLEVAGNKVKIAAENIGAILAPQVAKAAEGFSKYLDNLTDVAKAHPDATKGVVGFTAALGGLLTIGGGVGIALGGLQTTIAAVSAASMAFIASPAGLIALAVLGLGGAAYALYNKAQKTYAETSGAGGMVLSAKRSDTGADVFKKSAGTDLFAQVEANKAAVAAGTGKGKLTFAGMAGEQVEINKDKNKKIIENEKDTTLDFLKELDKRKGAVSAYYLGTGEGRGSLITDIFQAERSDVKTGGIGESLRKAVGGAKSAGNILIQKLELPGVTNPGEFITELNKLAMQSGIG
jgi:TP901 family phage tail tape measure protein